MTSLVYLSSMAHNEYKTKRSVRGGGDGARILLTGHTSGELGAPSKVGAVKTILASAARCTSGFETLNQPSLPPNSGFCRHFKRKHKLRDMVGSSAYSCLHCSGAVKISSNPYQPLYGLDREPRETKEKDRCARSSQLRRKAQKIVKLLAVDQSLKAVTPLPPTFVCGELRTKVRSMYAPELTLVQELSIKTSAKAESQPCSFCEGLQEGKMEQWKVRRLQPVDVSQRSLEEFGVAFAKNIPTGWNLRRSPYVPNGHASKSNQRCQGGNWNEEAFDTGCSVQLVHSAGKPRIVTLYSSYNVAVLTPLHHSLFASIKKKNWLLVGAPTDERLRYLAAGCKGDLWHSFDYESATDNIKTAYVQRAVEILIAKGEGLTDDEVRCLRVLSNLELDRGVATTGQPMGSPMSFPLLCLVNKTVVDLALTDLLQAGEIQFKEWTGHRCLINGDDLLTRSTSSGRLESAIARRGSEIGLIVNKEKTLTDPEYGEINSTVFKNCVRQKKTNVAALWMGSEVGDCLGFAHESTRTGTGFSMVAQNNATRLARQKIKTSVELPYSRKMLVLSCGKLKTALKSVPTSSVPEVTNLFPVVAEPDGYDLTREEEDCAIGLEVQRVRERGAWKALPSEKRKNTAARKAVRSELCSRLKPFSLLRKKEPDGKERVLLCLARAWEKKVKNEIFLAEPVEYPCLIVSDFSRIAAFEDEIKAFKDKRKGVRPIPSEPLGGCPFSRGDGYVSLTDA
ncbi:RNA-dependent RNA polymerase [Erysiphe necator associated ourmia-like virus 58]|nr:RNA-dependent RNA polymerase [Erysiphe necator associated ourmia-like virus 58]